MMEIFVGFRNAKYADECFLSDTPAYGYAAPEFLSSGEPPNLLVFCPFVAVNYFFNKKRKEVINLVCTIVHGCKKSVYLSYVNLVITTIMLPSRLNSSA